MLGSVSGVGYYSSWTDPIKRRLLRKLSLMCSLLSKGPFSQNLFSAYFTYVFATAKTLTRLRNVLARTCWYGTLLVRCFLGRLSIFHLLFFNCKYPDQTARMHIHICLNRWHNQLIYVPSLYGPTLFRHGPSLVTTTESVFVFLF